MRTPLKRGVNSSEPDRLPAPLLISGIAFIDQLHIHIFIPVNDIKIDQGQVRMFNWHSTYPHIDKLPSS